LAAIFENQEIKAALSEKKTVRAPHHFLAAKIPDIELDLAMAWRPSLDLYLFMLNDAGGPGFVRIARLSPHQIPKERRLADRLIADHEEFQFVQWPQSLLLLRKDKAAVRGKNGRGI